MNSSDIVAKYVYLSAKRSNPELNPRETPMESIKKYYKKYGKNLYISFTRLSKLGINPAKSVYSTPNGIYTYNIHDVWHQIKKLDDISKWDMFQTDAKYIQVIVPKNKKNVLHLDRYSKKDWERDLKKLEKIYPEFNKNEEPYKKNISRSKLFGKKMWRTTYLLSRNPDDVTKTTNRWNALLRKDLGYPIIQDNGLEIIYPTEPEQTVFLSKIYLNHIDTLYNKSASIFSVDEEQLSKFSDEQEKRLLPKLFRRFSWLAEANFEDAVISINKKGQLLWHSGTWLNGVWKYGVWLDGHFSDNGEEEDSVWKDGIWKDGYFAGKVWENGTWEDGTFARGVWKNGHWKNGDWDTYDESTGEGGKWIDGIWEKGNISNIDAYGREYSENPPPS